MPNSGRRLLAVTSRPKAAASSRSKSEWVEGVGNDAYLYAVSEVYTAGKDYRYGREAHRQRGRAIPCRPWQRAAVRGQNWQGGLPAGFDRSWMYADRNSSWQARLSVSPTPRNPRAGRELGVRYVLEECERIYWYEPGHFRAAAIVRNWRVNGLSTDVAARTVRDPFSNITDSASSSSTCEARSHTASRSLVESEAANRPQFGRKVSSGSNAVTLPSDCWSS